MGDGEGGGDHELVVHRVGGALGAVREREFGDEHAVAAIRWNGDFSSNNVGFVQNVWFVAWKDAGQRSGVSEHIPACRKAWALSGDARKT